MSPHRVLIVDHGESVGGSAIVAAAIAAHMPTARYEIHVATAFDSGLLRLDASVRHRSLSLRKAYGYVDQATARGRWAGLPHSLRRAAGRGVFLVRMVRNSGYVRSVAEYIRRHQIDILHLNNGFENLEAHFAAGLTGRRTVIHAHGPCGPAKLTGFLARRAGQCLAISSEVAASLVRAGARPDRVATLPNPLTVSPAPLGASERERARARYQVPAGATVVGSVGRLVPWKGQLEFLRAAALAFREHPTAHAVIVGEVTDGSDDYGALLRQEVAALGIQHRVTFTGFISDPREVYSLIDILVHTSIKPEPFGLVLTEAMAGGIPVIAANRGGPCEILTDEIDGFLRDPRDAAALGATIARLLGEDRLRAEIGAAGRASALARFDPDQYVAHLAAIYDRVLAFMAPA